MRLNATTVGAAATNPFFTLSILVCISVVGWHDVFRIRFAQKSPHRLTRFAQRVLRTGLASLLSKPSAPNPAPAETNLARMQARGKD
jgi:hypothetical protein